MKPTAGFVVGHKRDNTDGSVSGALGTEYVLVYTSELQFLSLVPGHRENCREIKHV